MITRRALLIAIGVGAVAGQRTSFAQQQGTRIARIGLLISATRGKDSPATEPFMAGLRDHGYIVGKNLLVEARYADTRLERLPALAAELVSLRPDVIVAVGTTATDAARKATSSIPIVMLNVGDPVASGFVKSLRQPGLNITGTSNVGPELIRKHLEIALQISPALPRVAVLFNPDNPIHRPTVAELSPEASRLKLELIPAPARNLDEITSAFGTIGSRGARFVIIRLDPLFHVNVRNIAELALKNGVSTLAARENYVAAGCLLSYGPNLEEPYRRGGYYVDRILKGARPGDLPVELPTKFELHVNLKTAKALGITIPQSLLLTADKVIE